MARRPAARVHLLAHANPFCHGLERFGWQRPNEYLDFVRAQLPAGVRLTADHAILQALEDPDRGGRRDDARRVRDLNAALADPNTLALVSASGGAWLTRLLPKLDWTPLARRTRPLWVFGFSELTTLVNLAATWRMGRGVYWLCPNYLGWKLEPPEAARAALASFWQGLSGWCGGAPPVCPLPVLVRGRWVAGRLPPTPARVRVLGGCLSVLAAMLVGAAGRRLRPAGRWLVLEDLREEPYRIDRCLATLKLAGWFDQIAGVLVGDFHTRTGDTQPAVVELLRYHLPRQRRIPVVTTRDIGHVWPMSPLPLNQPLVLKRAGRDLLFGSAENPRSASP